MTARTATVRFYVALVTLLTAVVALVGAVVRLLAAGVSLAALRVERRRAPTGPRQGGARAPAARLRLVPTVPAADPAGSARERLTVALTGLGFKVPDVRRFVTSLGARVEMEPIEGLIKAGLAALTAAA